MYSNFLFLKTIIELNGTADLIRKEFNIRSKNPSTPIKDQNRECLNYGGEYYVFEVLTLRVYLLNNGGEIQFEELPDFTYFIYLEVESESHDFVEQLFNFLSTTLQKAISLIDSSSDFRTLSAPELNTTSKT